MFSQGNFLKALFRHPYNNEFRLSKIEGQLKGGAAPAAAPAPAAAAEDDDDVDLFASDDEVDEEAERIKVKNNSFLHQFLM